MDYKDTSKETLNKHINHIIDICDSIPVDKITVLNNEIANVLKSDESTGIISLVNHCSYDISL